MTLLVHQKRKGGGAIPYVKINTFVDNINNCQLIDLGSVGTKFTWKGPLYHDGFHIFKRLDRALSNANWRLRFHEAYVNVRVLARVSYSDHHPILIVTRGDQNNVRRRNFRFENLWLTESTYLEQVKQSWSTGNNIEDNLTQLASKRSDWKLNTVAAVNKRKERF